MSGYRNGAKQRGMALVQVIIITSIIMLLMIYFLQVAKNQVNRAAGLQDKTQAYLANYSAENALLFRLLTSNPVLLQSEGWNFHGQPFKAGEHTQVAVQDLNGLLSLAVLSRPEQLQRLLSQVIPPGQAHALAASIVDWVDMDSIARPGGAENDHYQTIGVKAANSPIQTFTELPFIKGMTWEAEQFLIANSTIHLTTYFNPVTAPEGALKAYFNSEGIAAQVIQMRAQQQFDSNSVVEVTGVTAEDGLDYISGPGYRFTISSKVGDSFYGRVLEYGVFPYKDEPLVLFSRTPAQQRTR